MAEAKSLKIDAKKLFEKQKELLERVPREERQNLRLTIFLSVYTSLELMKLMMMTGNTAKVNQIVDELEEMMRETLPKAVVNVRTAVELDPVDEEKLRAALEKILNKEVVLKTKVDKKILGGMILEREGRVMDLSLDGELAKFKQYLLEGLTAINE